jgi:hypothetical protein
MSPQGLKPKRPEASASGLFGFLCVIIGAAAAGRL